MQSQNYIRTDCRSTSPPWWQAPIWDRDQFLFFPLLIIFRQLRVCWCGAPSLTIGRVCSFQLLLCHARAVFVWSGSREIHDHILLSKLLDCHELNAYPYEAEVQVKLWPTVCRPVYLYLSYLHFILNPQHFPLCLVFHLTFLQSTSPSFLLPPFPSSAPSCSQQL
jgi:hypothetical protein